MPTYSLDFEREYRAVERINSLIRYFDILEEQLAIEALNTMKDIIKKRILAAVRVYGAALLSNEEVEFRL